MKSESKVKNRIKSVTDPQHLVISTLVSLGRNNTDPFTFFLPLLDIDLYFLLARRLQW
jgi:hypothetical protein